MRIKTIFIYLFLQVFASCTAVHINADNKVNFHLEIKQIVSGSYTQNTYVVSENMLKIYEKRSTKDGQLIVRRIFSKKLKLTEIENIETLSNSLFVLKSKYINPQIGGIRWEINITMKEKIKEIIIENDNIVEISALFDAINNIIPNRKPILYKY